MGVYWCPDSGVLVSKGINIEWDGLDEFQKFLKETPGIVRRDVEAGLVQEGENIMGVSKQRTPVDLGPLKASGHVKLPKTKRGETDVTLAYGTDYALAVHERVSRPVTSGPVFHRVGQAKFLESAMKDAARGFGARMKRRVLDRLIRRRAR